MGNVNKRRSRHRKVQRKRSRLINGKRRRGEIFKEEEA